MVRIQVLLSAYNGSAFLKEQLDSILGQRGVEVELLIRDDGSTDGTVDILRRYERERKNVHVTEGKNTGVTASFFALLAAADAEYVAFADQDDIWLPEKLKNAVQKLAQVDGPALYAGNKTLVDRDGHRMKKQDTGRRKPSFENALVESICTGCTIVMNRKLVQQIQEKLPRHAVLHDWWCYLVASYLGTVIYDETSYIYYRQHGDNAVGASSHVLGRMADQLRYIRRSRGKLAAQLAEFHNLYHENPDKDGKVQEVLAGKTLKGRVRLLFSGDIKRQRALDDLVMRVLFLAGWML